VRIEDAGFEIRDQLQWIYGQGFPKSLDISKAIDKAAGAEREVIGDKTFADGSKARKTQKLGGNSTFADPISRDSNLVITAPATPEAKHWSGWGTALKPANEPIVLARKPVEGTIAANVLKYGCGGLNIDGCRIETSEKLSIGSGKLMNGLTQGNGAKGILCEQHALGRFPSNVLLDETAAEMLDAQSIAGGIHSAGKARDKWIESEARKDSAAYHMGAKHNVRRLDDGDKIGASRFFYVAKASKGERGKDNLHPTVKPVKLMQYLVRLVTPKGGVCLDPFMGSGTTGVACAKEGFDFIGIERDPQYFEIAERRIEFEQVWPEGNGEEK
jgi:site-specific DNA-methyltransferase (adenine-specific)